jgi:hypothetical protein
MTSKRETRPHAEPEPGELQNKMFRLSAEAVQAFDILKARQGTRSGPRLAGEAIDLLLIKYGEQPVGPLRDTTKSKKRV